MMLQNEKHCNAFDGFGKISDYPIKGLGPMITSAYCISKTTN